MDVKLASKLVFMLSFSFRRLHMKSTTWRPFPLVKTFHYKGQRKVPTLFFAPVGIVASAVSWTLANTLLADSSTKDEMEKDSKAKLSNVIAEADALYDQVKYEAMYELLLQYKNSINDEVLWRLGRAAYEKSKLIQSKDEKIQLLKQAKEYVYNSLKLNKENFAGHKWASILVVELAEHEGTKAKIQQSIVSKNHMLRAHALNPKDGTTLYLLGVWCYTFADLSWHQRKLAELIFASPPSSTYEEALGYFQKAEEVEPRFYSMNLLMLGKTYLKLNDKEKAIHYLKQARDYHQKTEEDKQAQKEASNLLKNIGAN